MRDLLDLITEGVGLANRKPNEKFTNEQGDTLTFKSVEFFPQGGGTFDDADHLALAISQVCEELGIDESQIIWENGNSGLRGFGIAILTNSAGNNVYYGRYYRSINANKTLNSWPNKFSGGYNYQSKVAKKESAGYKPTDLLKTFEGHTPETLYKEVEATLGEAHDLTVAMRIFMKATSFPLEIPIGEINPDAFSDYFCEILQPMALVMGKPVEGNAGEAGEIFFGPNGYNNCTINFHTDVSGGLYDSLLVDNKGNEIKLSTKAKGGANASILNLLNSVNDMKRTPQGGRLLQEYANEVKIMHTIQEGGHTDGCLNLAVQFKMIDDKERKQVKRLKGLGPEDEILGTGMLSERLESLYKGRKAADPSRIIPIEHMLAAIAYPVAEYVNEKTNFGSAASAILNHGALVQVYTTIKQTEGKIILDPFHTVFPSDTVSGVLMRADKTYMSTQGKGNFTFKILKNGATDADTKALDSAPAPEETPAKAKPQPKKPTRTDIKAADRSSKSSKIDDKALGRGRR